jgi:soluble lytic murein transglycosylase-like protein
VALAEGRRLASIDQTPTLYGAWLLLGNDHPQGRASRDHLLRHLEQSSRSRQFLEMKKLPPSEWSIWSEEPRKPEELLLTLGILEHMFPAMYRHFPLADLSSGLTGAQMLAQSGLHQPSLRMAEILTQRLPRELPHQLLPEDYRRSLYPYPFSATIRQQARRFEVDPHLLTAIIREESRFDPLAVSPASALGLTQFVLPTARRLGEQIGLARVEPRDLHRPEISIVLGAAYLAELEDRYAADPIRMIAAYNAGEHQADLWQSYSYSREPAEYFSKVGFSQTRSYVENVVRSWNQYRAIYGEDAAPASAD